MDRTIITDHNGVHTEVHYHTSGPVDWATRWHQTHAPAFAGWVLAALLVIWAALYVLPSLVARLRGVHAFGAVVLVNLLLGWTMLGWVVALTMALVMERRADYEMRVMAYRAWADGQTAIERRA
jgi:Superinfection immunity protein